MAKPSASWSSFCFGVVACLLALLGGVAELGAQSPTWQQRPVTAPSARNSSAAAYDVYRGVTTVFGGYNGTNTALGDTWEWNGTLWAPRITAVRPNARWGHGMAFDQKRGRVVLFGGYDGTSMRNDTWEWDGFTWVQRSTPVAPSIRGYVAMAYDAARGVCVLFGGLGGSGTSLADTWEFDGATWSLCSTAGAPSPRRNASCAWDEARREMLVFGGGDGAQTFSDLWAWNGTTWSQKATTGGPSARWAASLAFDGNCGRAVLHGGADQAFASNFGDAWAWDGVQWAQVASAAPVARHGAVQVHDAQRGQFVLWGGRDAAGFRNDTWELGPSCSRTMSVVAAPVVGQTAQFRYDYPGTAANLHFCWTLLTPRQPAAFAVPIPGLPTIGLCRVDLFNQLLDPAVFLDGSGALVTSVPIPASNVFAGFEFDVQSVDLDFFTLALRWASNDVEVTTAGLVVPVASFTATPTSGNAPLTVQFTDTSTQWPTAWQWDFENDGVVDSTQQNPSWTYTSNGVYSVRLVATNFVGSGAVTRSNLVFVGPLLPNPLLNMVPIAPGTYQRGSPVTPLNVAPYFNHATAQPVHPVTISRPFWIGRFEVTQAQYQAVMGSNPSFFQGASYPNAAQRPVETVSFYAANAYCAALTVSEQAAGRVPAGYGYRLPTEAEWEYCCRAGTTTEFHTGATLACGQANFNFSNHSNAYCSINQTAVVGSYAPNAWGLHDMHGNVEEWCQDAWDYSANYPSGAVTDPLVGSGLVYVLRGGAWGGDSYVCRSAARSGADPSFTSLINGFRVVLVPNGVP
jgi:formylglycine-generating enzyme required for sulfatase activity